MSKVSDDKADELRANVLDQQIRDLEARLKKSDEKNDEILASLEELHESRNSLAPRSVTFSKNLLGKRHPVKLDLLCQYSCSKPIEF